LAKPEKVYWDSCAWLGLANGEQSRVHDLDSIYTLARDGGVEIWTSTMSIVEVNRLSAEMMQPKPIPPDSLSVLDDLFFQPFIKLVPLDTPISRLARKLIRETPKLRKRPDAVHLATAMFWNIPTLFTYDADDLLHLNGILKCSDGTNLTICEPGDSGLGGLFGKAQPAS
tara:strand:+ start:1858 stop:2367 length:510 start_codon:yes stop_codon:yes gene_type:complete